MINSYNIALMNGSPWGTGTLNVEIHSAMMEKHWNKTLTKIPLAVSRGNQPVEGGVGSATTKIIDLLRTERLYVINSGYITGSPTILEVGSSREKIEHDLGSLINYGGVVNMTWKPDDTTLPDEWHTINFDKVMTKHDSTKDNTFFIQMTLTEGVDA